jgi:hypothetical protein
VREAGPGSETCAGGDRPTGTRQQSEVAAPLHPHQRTGHVMKLLHKEQLINMKNWALIVLYTGAVTPPNIKEKSKYVKV